MDSDGLLSEWVSPQRELARKINLLLDVVVAEGNAPYTYRKIAEGLREKGVSLSRARWAYMLRGEGPLVTDVRLLTEIARFFQVDPSYLLGSEEGDLPERIDSQLQFVKAIRAARVVSFATRILGDVSPETLKSIAELLQKDIATVPASTESSSAWDADRGSE
jgi:transcriptional regulator with XRE-family HTH domain